MSKPKIILEGDQAEAAKWVPWAMKRLNILAQSGSNFTSRYLQPTDGVSVYLSNLSTLQSVRISALSGNRILYSMDHFRDSTSKYTWWEYKKKTGTQPVFPEWRITRPTPSFTEHNGWIYYLEDVKYSSGSKLTGKIAWVPSTQAPPYLDPDTFNVNSSNGPKIASDKLVDMVIGLIRNKQFRHANYMLNSDTSEFAKFGLVLAQVELSLLYKQFNPPLSSDPLFSDYQKILSAARQVKAQEVPEDKFILELEHFRLAEMEVFGLTPGNVSLPPPNAGDSVTHVGTFLGPESCMNLVSGYVWVDYVASNLFSPGITSQTVSYDLSIKITKYDPQQMDFVTTVISSASTVGSFNTFAMAGPSETIPPTGQIVVRTVNFDSPAYTYTYDGPERAGTFASVARSFEQASGTINQCFTDVVYTTYSPDPSQTPDKWKSFTFISGKELMDVYSNGDVKKNGELLFNLSGYARFTVNEAYGTNDLVGFRVGSTYEPLLRQDFGVNPSFTNYVMLSRTDVFSNLEPAFSGIPPYNVNLTQTNTPSTRRIGSSESLTQVELFQINPTPYAIKWPGIVNGDDGLFIAYRKDTQEGFQLATSGTRSYLEALRTGSKSSEELSSLALSIASSWIIVYNNLVSEENIVLLAPLLLESFEGLIS